LRPGSKFENERDFFEFDRSVLITQLDAILLTGRSAVTDLAMLAAESVFDRPLSEKIKRKARNLDRMARRLDDLGKVLARAKFPRVKN
jgi:DNA-binding transcriptional regulator GbsR (MarR family)